MALTIEKAKPSDAAIVALLGRLTFRETFAALFLQHEDELRAYLDKTFCPAKIEASIGKPENCYWLASVDGLPVGYGKLKFPSTNPACEGDAPAQLQKIYVLSEFIAMKVGHRLMDEICAEGARLAVDEMWLNVLSSNDHAIRFYERHGWIRTGDATYDIGSQSFHFLTLSATLSRSPASAPTA